MAGAPGTSRGGGGDGPAVHSLDQLFNQAAALDPFLRRKALALALGADGRLPIAVNLEGSEALSYQRARELAESDSAGRIRWAGLKPTERALEKLLRCYDCEVARLLDCCRQAVASDAPQPKLQICSKIKNKITNPRLKL